MTTYTDEQVLRLSEAVPTEHIANVLRSLLDDRTRLQTEVKALRDGIDQIANNIGESLNAGCDQDAVNRIGGYVSELFALAAIASARAKKGDV